MDELIKIQKENQEILRDILKHTKKTANYFKWKKIEEFIKLLLIIAVIFGSIIYMPLIVEKTVDYLKNLIPLPVNTQNIDMEKIIKNFKNQ